MRKSNEKSAVTATTGGKKNHLAAKIYKYRGFYLMFLPVLIFALIFFYLPMLGIRFAFTDYNGIKEASFVGLKNFQKMFSMPNFWTAFWNTLQISIIKLFLTTAAAVIVSIFLNEIANIHFKKIVHPRIQWFWCNSGPLPGTLRPGTFPGKGGSAGRWWECSFLS